MVHDIMETSLGKPIQAGEFKKNPAEPAWICPSDYKYKIIDKEPFKVEYLRPGGVATGRVVLQLHGGGYIDPMRNIYGKLSVRYSRLSYDGDMLAVDYRAAPGHPYPAVLEDAIHAYQRLIEEEHYKPEQVVVAGDLAGDGLILALCLFLRDHGMPQPVGLILMSPWTDLICGGNSYEFNFEHDLLFGNPRESTLYDSSYIGGSDPRDPYISPVFGDFRGPLPILLRVGSHEMLLNDTLEVAQNVWRTGVKRRVSVYEGMFHVLQMSIDLIPESREAWDEVVRFMQAVYKANRRPTGQVVKKVKRRR